MQRLMTIPSVGPQEQKPICRSNGCNTLKGIEPLQQPAKSLGRVDGFD